MKSHLVPCVILLLFGENVNSRLGEPEEGVLMIHNPVDQIENFLGESQLKSLRLKDFVLYIKRLLNLSKDVILEPFPNLLIGAEGIPTRAGFHRYKAEFRINENKGTCIRMYFNLSHSLPADLESNEVYIGEIVIYEDTSEFPYSMKNYYQFRLGE